MGYIEKEDVYAPLQAVRAGRTGKPVTYTKGGEYAYGEIVFADNPTAADTITLNGVVIEFSASASDFTTAGTVADPYILNIKADLTLTLDELVTQTNGSANADLAVATYSEDGTDTFEITYDTLGTAGNAYTLAASADTVSGANLTGGAAAVALDLGTENIDIQISDTRDQYFTLADAKEAFTKKTIAITAKGTGNAIITPTNYTDGTTLTFDADGEIWTGIFINGAWKTLVTTGTEA